jgi:acyl transferase domain-containing protein
MEPIAIIGMACRLPGAQSLSEFWTLLREGRHGIGSIPESRWDRERTFDPDPEKPGKINTRHGGFIEGIDLFDHDFFGITPEEARQMDPQQRILLELTYEAFEDAGLSTADLEGSDTGVFVGVMSNDYLRLQTAGDFHSIDKHTGAGSGYCMIANRISYQFNLRGPSMAIDSACSSSLVSAFTACQSLWTNQCSLALAAGVNLILSPVLSVFYTRAGLSAPDARCRTLSDDAMGMCRGEGAGMVVLKRLSDAVRDGDNIYAVIRGGAVNHNGRGNGMSAPSRWAQDKLLRRAFAHAGVAPSELQYVELHGTGTLIGDAIEATALGSILTEGRDRNRPCLVGSVKTNLGHLEGAAGVAGLVKLALCLKRGQLVPSLWFNAPNPHVDLDTLSLKVQERFEDWPAHEQTRTAGISSFGLGGANAHLVLQHGSYMESRPATGDEMSCFVLQLSARSEAALTQMASRTCDFIQGLDAGGFSAFCRSSLVRPPSHAYRATCAASTRDEIIVQLSRLSAAEAATNTFTGRYRDLPRRKRTFVFPEFSHNAWRAAAQLAETHACFRQALEQCDAALEEVVPHPLLTQVSDSRTLPFACFGVQVALTTLWRTAGLQPDSVAGTGMGQITACWAAGAIDLKSAMARIAALHGFDLTSTGSAWLDRSSPFLLDAFSSQGKNSIPDLSSLTMSSSSISNLFTLVPGLSDNNNTDFILQTMDETQAERLRAGISNVSLIGVFNSQSFWVELARLSIQHNVQWKNLLAPQGFVRPLHYPWQKVRHWLENGLSENAAAPQFQPEHATRKTDARAQEIIPPHSGLTDGDLFQLPEQERRAALAAYLKQQVARTLQRPVDDFEEPQSIVSLGLDSLAALQLKNRVEQDLKTPVSLVKLIDGQSISDLAADLLSRGLQQDGTGRALPGRAGSERAGNEPDRMLNNDLQARIEAMSGEHVDQMLRQLLAASAAPTQP